MLQCKKDVTIHEAAKYILAHGNIRTKNLDSIIDTIYRYLYKKRKVSHAYNYQWEYNY